MTRIIFQLGFLVVFLATGTSGLCQSVPSVTPTYHPGIRACSLQQPVQPVARSVQVTVPMPQPPKPFPPPACLPSPPYCPAAATAPARPMPVRVDIAVRPEECDQRRPVPVVYRDPGFLGPIVSHSLGLVGATIAAPFRVAEMLFPLDASPRSPQRQCGPRSHVPSCGYQPPASPRFAPECPAPVTQPMASCAPVLSCTPPGPSVAPLPPCALPPPCGPFMPPALVEREEEPPCAPQSLLGGIVQLPFTLAGRGRFIGDIGRSPAAWGDGNR